MKKLVETLSKYGLGLRTMKTAISVFLCMLLFYIVNIICGIPKDSLAHWSSLYACAAAIICLQSTVQETIKSGISRLLGTAVGGAIALIILTFDSSLNEIARMAVISLGVIVAISLCNILKKKKGAGIACVCLIVIMVNHSQVDKYVYAIQRMIETGTGVIVAAFVNSLFKNPLDN